MTRAFRDGHSASSMWKHIVGGSVGGLVVGVLWGLVVGLVGGFVGGLLAGLGAAIQHYTAPYYVKFLTISVQRNVNVGSWRIEL